MDKTDKFITEHGRDAFTRIFEVIIGDAAYDDIELAERHMRDAANYYGYVIYRTPDGKEIVCNYADGDMGGSEITGYGADVEPVAETTIMRRFVLDEAGIPLEKLNLMRAKFTAMKDVIAEKERAYNYDIRFCPTDVIRNHYRDWLKERHLTTVIEEVDRV